MRRRSTILTISAGLTLLALGPVNAFASTEGSSIGAPPAVTTPGAEVASEPVPTQTTPAETTPTQAPAEPAPPVTAAEPPPAVQGAHPQHTTGGGRTGAHSTGGGAKTGGNGSEEGKGSAQVRASHKAAAPSALTPALPLALQGGVGGVPNFFIEDFEIPPFLLPIFQAAGAAYGIPWQVLAAINEV